jgi:hypothetical protein
VNLRDRIKNLHLSPIVSAALNAIQDPKEREAAETAVKQLIEESLVAFGPIGHFDVPEVPSHEMIKNLDAVGKVKING